MSLPKVYVARRVQETGMSLLAGRVDYEVWEGDGPVDRAVLMEKSADAEGLLATLSDRIDEELLTACPRLRVVSNYAVGFDNIDVPAATERKIIVTNTPDVLTDATADIAFTLLLASARRVVEANEFLRSGDWVTWKPDLLLGADVSGATLGIVGMGKIGQAVARRGRGFGMKILYVNRSSREEAERELGARRVSFEELLAESDFISLHCPLSDETRGLIDERALRAMKKTAFVINTSRGPVVDQGALFKACSEGWIAGAGLDVFDVEPVPLDEPLLTLKNVTTLPHLGSATVRTREAMARKAAENLLAALDGRRPADLVNPEVFD
ncbi:MAG: D-glycerate dehydrogenase [Synergistaceae bacterium]|nr:D-glycerate dehydrogenase [Synergistota bacterium]NLM70938.1 D-glycerate dehydrogenase [Synergistaceae bacterium]